MKTLAFVILGIFLAVVIFLAGVGLGARIPEACAQVGGCEFYSRASMIELLQKAYQAGREDAKGSKF